MRRGAPPRRTSPNRRSTQIPVSESDLALPAGRLHLRRHGADGGAPVLCIPGLSANAVSFDVIGATLAAAGRSVVALDLRGRGHSEVTPPGTYGWTAHARDVLDITARIATGPVDVVGHSMGAYVALAAAGLGPEQVCRLVLVDGAGPPQAAAMAPILAGVERLGALVGSEEEHLARVRALGVIEPWSVLWDEYYRYELRAVDGGVRTRTDRGAVMEDLRWGADHDPRDLWAGVRCPSLLVKATRPIGDGGFVLSAEDRDAYLAQVPGAKGVEVDANHYTVISDPATARAVVEFLDA